MTESEYKEMMKYGSKAFIKANSEASCLPPSPIIKQSAGKALHGISKDETRILERYRVSFTCYRVRKQDPDNAVVKWFVDAIRRAKIIPDDTEEVIELSIKQVKCSTKKAERTEIIIEQIN